ncbi:MAG TPA: hypothetical protein VMT03_18575 [Polyangia bacterium]|nr:hypothetical protein [Polyangia bacterium]
MATSSTRKLVVARAILLGTTVLAIGCSSSSNNGVTADTPAGVVLGPLDNHCTSPDGGLMVQTVGVCEVIDTSAVPKDTSICAPVTFGGASADDTSGDDSSDAGASDAAATSDYGATMYGSAGNDDDCKYYVSWVSTPIQENADTYFTVTALRLSDMQPVRCAGIRPDTSLSLTHGVPAPSQPATEISPGVYKVGPIRFDAPGTWTERFHLFEECSDDPDDSPHGHAAFYINVP